MYGWEFPPNNVGGLGTACHGLTKGLVEKGADVVFVLPSGEEIEDSHVKVVIADKKRGSIKIKKVDSSLAAYMTSIEYSLRSAFEFIEKYLVQDTLIILIGDHQPTALSTYSNLVPVHIISRKSNLLTSFQHIGFRKELFSPVSRGNITHEDFAKFLLQSYSCCKGVID